MATIGNLAFQVTLAAGGFHRNMAAVAANLTKVGNQVAAAGKTGGLGVTMEKVAASVYLAKTAFSMLWSVVTAPFSFAQDAVEAAAKWETLETTLGVLTGSAEKAKSILSELGRFAKGSPVSVVELAASTQRLAAYGFEAEQALGITERLAILTSAFPGDSAEAMGRLAVAIGQMSGKGRVMTQEMNQLSESGAMGIWKELGKILGTDVGGAMKKVGEGAVDANLGIQAAMNLATSPKLMAAWEARKNTLEGLWTSVKSSWAGAMRDLGFILIEGLDLKGGAKSLEEFISLGREKLQEWKPALQEFLSTLRDVLITAALGFIEFGQEVIGVFRDIGTTAKEAKWWVTPLTDTPADTSWWNKPLTGTIFDTDWWTGHANTPAVVQTKTTEPFGAVQKRWQDLFKIFTGPTPSKPWWTEPVHPTVTAALGPLGEAAVQAAQFTMPGLLGGALAMAPKLATDNKNRLAELAKAEGKSERRIADISAEFASPLAKFQTKVAELQELRKKSMHEDVFALAMQDAFAELEKSLGHTQMKLPETAIKGSMEAARAIVQHQLRRAKPEDRAVRVLEEVRELEKKQLEEAKKLTALLQDVGVAGLGLGIP